MGGREVREGENFGVSSRTPIEGHCAVSVRRIAARTTKNSRTSPPPILPVNLAGPRHQPPGWKQPETCRKAGPRDVPASFCKRAARGSLILQGGWEGGRYARARIWVSSRTPIEGHCAVSVRRIAARTTKNSRTSPPPILPVNLAGPRHQPSGWKQPETCRKAGPRDDTRASANEPRLGSPLFRACRVRRDLATLWACPGPLVWSCCSALCWVAALARGAIHYRPRGATSFATRPRASNAKSFTSPRLASPNASKTIPAMKLVAFSSTRRSVAFARRPAP